MKKTYMKPELEQVMIETQGLIAASPFTYSEEGGGVESASLIDTEVGGTSVNVMSKDNDFDLWDEE